MTQDHRIKGIWCASLTPLRPDLSIDTDRLAAHVRQLLASGCHGVALFGTTGEANSFSVAERGDAVAVLVEKGLPMSRILVGAGACAVPDVIALSGAAVRSGALGVLIHPPFYYRDASDAGIAAFLDRIVTGVGPDRLRVVLYHFPRLAGIGYSEELISRLVQDHPEVIIGLKDSSGDLDRMARLAAEHPGLAVLPGNEALLLPGLGLGMAGCLTASANFTSALARRVYDERSPELQVRLTAARVALATSPFVPGLKRLMADVTGEPGWGLIRPPLQGLDDPQRDAFREQVRPVAADLNRFD